jgi:hypothetical protein
MRASIEVYTDKEVRRELQRLSKAVKAHYLNHWTSDEFMMEPKLELLDRSNKTILKQTIRDFKIGTNIVFAGDGGKAMHFWGQFVLFVKFEQNCWVKC